jgi:hypothetical protein
LTIVDLKFEALLLALHDYCRAGGAAGPARAELLHKGSDGRATVIDRSGVAVTFRAEGNLFQNVYFDPSSRAHDDLKVGDVVLILPGIHRREGQPQRKLSRARHHDRAQRPTRSSSRRRLS